MVEALRSYTAERGITHKGGVKQDGKFWRARLEFSDTNEIFHGTGFSKQEAIDRAISFALQARETPSTPPSNPINLGNALKEGYRKG
jgi:hypothetical protein